jgi:hypothetical protein
MVSWLKRGIAALAILSVIGIAVPSLARSMPGQHADRMAILAHYNASVSEAGWQAQAGDKQASADVLQAAYYLSVAYTYATDAD